MMCPDMEVRLNEYVDGTLAARDRGAAVAVEAHLAGCAGCRAAVAELRQLVADARALPRSIEPLRDLWAGVAARLSHRERRTTWWRERTFWAGALAAAATLVLAFALYRLTAPPKIPPTADRNWVAVQADYDQAEQELAHLLATQRGRLQPSTVALVARNLSIIDAAIGESRAALARDPANAELRSLVATASRQKVELLQWATRVAAAS